MKLLCGGIVFGSGCGTEQQMAIVALAVAVKGYPRSGSTAKTDVTSHCINGDLTHHPAPQCGVTRRIQGAAAVASCGIQWYLVSLSANYISPLRGLFAAKRETLPRLRPLSSAYINWSVLWYGETSLNSLIISLFFFFFTFLEETHRTDRSDSA